MENGLTFTVPAGALRIDLTKVLLVLLAGPFEAIREFVFIDLIIMIDKSIAGGIADSYSTPLG